jgi:hypothetical protein
MQRCVVRSSTSARDESQGPVAICSPSNALTHHTHHLCRTERTYIRSGDAVATSSDARSWIFLQRVQHLTPFPQHGDDSRR